MNVLNTLKEKNCRFLQDNWVIFFCALTSTADLSVAGNSTDTKIDGFFHEKTLFLLISNAAIEQLDHIWIDILIGKYFCRCIKVYNHLRKVVIKSNVKDVK